MKNGNIYSNSFLIVLCCLLFIACNLNDDSVQGGYGSESPSVSPQLKLDCPKDVPQGYPYSCQAVIEIPSSKTFSKSFAQSAEFSLKSNNCPGLTLASNGTISADLENMNLNDSCSYQIEGRLNGKSYEMDPVVLTIDEPIQMTFSNQYVAVQKSGGIQTVTLDLSPAAPYDAEISYLVYGSGALDALNGLGDSGSIFIPAGATSVEIDLEVTGTSSLVGTEYLNINILNGTSDAKPSLAVNLFENNIPSGFTQIDSNSYTTCAIRSGELWCWGVDNNNQTGNGATTTNVTVPTQVGASTNWTQVAMGSDHACGINDDNLYCWGDDGFGQLGNGGGTSNQNVPQLIDDSVAAWTDVASGSYFSCGILDDNLYCWGDDSAEALGNGAGGDQSSPQLINDSVAAWTDVTAGGGFACGILGGDLYCWGSDWREKLGDGIAGEGASQTTPYLTNNGGNTSDSGNWTVVSAGDTMACGIEAGKLFCWGEGDNGDLGSGVSERTSFHRRVGTHSDWTNIIIGTSHTCGIRNGELYCWGGDWNGQIGDGPSVTGNHYSPTRVGSSNQWSDMALGVDHTCGIDNGQLKCWGTIENGIVPIGDTSVENALVPTQVGTENNWEKISGSGGFCLIKNGELYCWGSDSNGQVGNGPNTSADVFAPERVGAADDWDFVDAGPVHRCGIRSGKLFCWGKNYNGELGIGSAGADVHSPVQVGNQTNWTRVAVGYSYNSNFTCGIESGRLFCWGRDTYGKLGNGAASTTDVLSPQQIGADNTWQEISLGSAHACGINAGKMYCWGRDNYGQVGNGAGSTDIEDPQQVGSDTTWTFISSGSGDHNCGLNAGQLWCWGSDGNGKVGNGAGTNNALSPYLTDSASTWTYISANGSNTCGVKAGDLYCWGHPGTGELGNNETGNANKHDPLLIDSSGTWQAVEVGACGLDDGRLFCWGSFSKGNLGQPDFFSSPALITEF